MKISRIVSIITILLDKKRISAQELAELFEVSLRTIYRDIDAINLAGIPVHATPGVGGGFEIMQNYKITNNVFSATDLSTILIGLSGLTNMVESQELINTLVKVKSFIPVEREADISLKTNQIQIDLSQWQTDRNVQSGLKSIKKALKNNQLIAFSYTNPRGQQTERKVEPYQIVLKGNQWYCYGYCHQRQAFRLFKLGRMSNLTVELTSFEPRSFEQPVFDFTEIWETIYTTIKLRVHQSVMDRVLDYCSLEAFSAEKDDYYLVDFPFVATDYYYSVLLSFGNKCECLAPMEVREEIKRKIAELTQLYQS